MTHLFFVPYCCILFLICSNENYKYHMYRMLSAVEGLRVQIYTYAVLHHYTLKTYLRLQKYSFLIMKILVQWRLGSTLKCVFLFWEIISF